MRRCSPWALLPVLFSTCTAIGLVLVYFIALEYDTIHSLGWRNSITWRPAPYISMAGNQPPASCVFSEVMNLAAFVGFIIGLLNYLQLKAKVRKPWLNIASLVTFSLACFGMTLVGNFQFTNDMDIHNAGTILTFGLGTVFCWLRTITTIRLNLRNEGIRVGITRFVLSAAITLSVVVYFILMLSGLHIHAARTQWCLVMFFLVFIGSLAVEFRHLRLGVVCGEHREPLPLSPSAPLSEEPEDHHSGAARQTQEETR